MSGSGSRQTSSVPHQGPRKDEDDEDFEESPRMESNILGWTRLSDLPSLPRIDKDSCIASTHRYHGSLSSLKLRVRLLEYPTTVETNSKEKDNRSGKSQHLAVIQDRVFSWQEKVDGNGKDGKPFEDKVVLLQSYVDTDPYVARQKNKEVVVTRRKQVPIPTTGQEDDEWEDADVDYKNLKSRAGSISIRTEEGENTEITTKKIEKDPEILNKGVKRRQEVKQRHAAVNDLLRQEEASVKGMIGQHLRGKRPHISLSSSMLPITSPKAHAIKADHDVEQKEVKSKVITLLPSFQRRTIAVEERSRQRRQLSLQSQSMIIVATIPHSSRRVVVCRLKALPTAGVITIKAPFGFRVIHASRTHVYRLSWELHLPGRKHSFPPNQALQLEKSFSRYGSGDGGGVSFESVEHDELRVWMMGEIVSARGFDSEPLCVHFLLETPTGWKITGDSLTEREGKWTTHSSYTTVDGVAHFSHHFSAQLSFSMDSLNYHTQHQQTESPVLLVMVVSIKDNGRVRHEGYGYASLPSTPGSHRLCILTWKPRHRSIVERMQDFFLDATPSLKDIKAAHIPLKEKSIVGNRLGLATDPSGEVIIRIHLTHHAPSSIRDQASKLELLEKMSSATILKSVQKVIDAFNRARNKTLLLKKGIET